MGEDEDKKMTGCKRKSCIYHAGNKIHGCNYIFITGNSKLGQIPHGEKYDIEKCQFYESGRKRSASMYSAIASPTPEELMREANSVDINKLKELYEADLCDSDIALLLGVSQRTIAKIRRQKGFVRTMSKGGSIRKIDWEGVDTMFSEGYSDIAISMFFNVPLEVIQKYKIIKARKDAEGGARDETY